MLRRTVCLSLAALLAPLRTSFAEKVYDLGASDTEIKLGQTMPFSGPVSAAATVGRASIAYFDAVNKAGGINGRRVKLFSMDDGFNPAKTVEVTRWLVESEEVLFIYGSVGVQGSGAVQKYLNTKKVPQLFLSTGASRFNDPKNYPWTMPILPSYVAEGKALARFVLKSVAEPKVAILYQNDDLGKDFVGGFKAGLGTKASTLVVSEQSYEVSDPTIDSRVVSAKASGANVFYFAGTQKFGAMQIRARAALDWKPLHLVCSISSGVESVLRPAGLENAEGLISSSFSKDPFDPTWRIDPDVVSYLEWMRVNLPHANPADSGYPGLHYVGSG